MKLQQNRLSLFAEILSVDDGKNENEEPTTSHKEDYDEIGDADTENVAATSDEPTNNELDEELRSRRQRRRRWIAALAVLFWLGLCCLAALLILRRNNNSGNDLVPTKAAEAPARELPLHSSKRFIPAENDDSFQRMMQDGDLTEDAYFIPADNDDSFQRMMQDGEGEGDLTDAEYDLTDAEYEDDNKNQYDDDDNNKNKIRSLHHNDPNYIGCFLDNKNGPERVMNEGPKAWGYTIESCIAECRRLEFPYAGLQNGGQCYCGNVYDTAGPDSGCVKPCIEPGAEPGSICGGSWRNSVYSTKIITSSPTVSASPTVSQSPTASPTASPTNFPTTTPTASPTSTPTSSPSMFPSESPSSSPSASINRNNPYYYIGCYKDGPERVMNEGPKNWGYTIESCLKECRELQFDYAGLQMGGECFCGNVYDTLGKDDSQADGGCDMPCEVVGAKPGSICGGGWRNSVYSTSKITQSPTASPTRTPSASPTSTPTSSLSPSSSPSASIDHDNLSFYIGCFLDNKKGPERVMNQGPKAWGYTIERCLATCQELEFKYAGLQNGGQCYCDNVYDTLGRDDRGGCSKPCIEPDAKPGSICGGSWRNSVYSTSKITQSPTASPTATPTSSPSTSPTAVPTASPTTTPSASPTVTPTTMPSVSPTSTPTSSPSTAPSVSPSSSPTAPINHNNPNFYVGCYKDGPDRVLNEGPKDWGYTIEHCLAECRKLQFNYAGLQNGGECFCGNTYDTMGQDDDQVDGGCNKPCRVRGAKPGSICGGNWRNSVYSTSKITPSPTASPTATPTSSPSTSPTAAPTASPTISGSPTALPSASPTSCDERNTLLEAELDDALMKNDRLRVTVNEQKETIQRQEREISLLQQRLDDVMSSWNISSFPSQSPHPSPAPSPSPTESSSPSHEPTQSQSPTVLPSLVPTESVSPSHEPSTAPSGLPTTSGQPSASPIPSVSPSESPTMFCPEITQVKARQTDPAWTNYKSVTADCLSQALGVPNEETKDPGYSVYGGRLDRQMTAGNGFFRVKQLDDGRWTFLDPDGYHFMSVGINSVNTNKDHELYKPGFAARFNNSLDVWAESTQSFLRGAGFNTIGSWSDNSHFQRQYSMPYCPRWNFMLTYKNRRRGGGWDIYRKPMPVWDPEFESFAMEHAKALATYKDDPWVLGHFSDNEMPFHADYLIHRYLNDMPEEDPNHQAALAWMKENNKTVETIGKADHDAFCVVMAERYYSVVSKAMKTYDPNHLFLGSRVHGRVSGQECTYIAASKYVDVVTVNYYHRWTPEQARMDKWARLSGRPIMITEWYAKGNDALTKPDEDPMPPVILHNVGGGGFTVPTQVDRGAFYQQFTLNLLRNRNVVGWHWFRYKDWNINCGIVNKDFRPYTEFVDAMERVNRNVYSLSDFLWNNTDETDIFLDGPTKA